MINRGQVEEMIDCYGADLARWPCENKKAIADFIANDSGLSEAFFAAQQLDQSVNELLVQEALEWSSVAESKLREKINTGLAGTHVSQNSTTWQQKLAALLEPIKESIMRPLLPTGMAALVIILVVFQLNFKGEEFVHDSASTYSVAELDDWLIVEGLASGQELLAEQDLLADAVLFENEEEIDSLSSEAIYFL